MYVYYNPNPLKRMVGDCSVRAVAKALDVDWDTAYAMLAQSGFTLADMPSSDSVWGAVLRRNGFEREVIPNECPDCYTAGDFCNEHPTGVYVLAFGGHVATVKNGDLYDSWESTNEIPQYVYKRKEK